LEGAEATLEGLGLFDSVEGISLTAVLLKEVGLEVLDSWRADTAGGELTAAAGCFRGTLVVMVCVLEAALVGSDEFEVMGRSGIWFAISLV
jgi:hypothetical protein